MDVCLGENSTDIMEGCLGENSNNKIFLNTKS